MQSNKSIFKRDLLNSLFFSSILILNTLNVQESTAKNQDNIDIPKILSYRSASCGCCKKWVKHLRDNGLEVVDNIVEDISEIKKQYNVTTNLRSCHSAKIGSYTIEGHVPIKSIKKLFQENPSILGIAVPGMPHGSPGMEKHSHESNSYSYETYKVVSFSNDGNTKKFDQILP